MNAWHNPKSYAPDCGELLAESWRKDLGGISGSRPSDQAQFHGPDASRVDPGRVATHIPALVLGFIAGLAAIAIPAIILTHGAIL